VEIGGYSIPAGVVLAPSNYLAQRHPSAWDAPSEFRPQRFLGDTPPAPYEYFPFGGGRRRCLGAAFAGFEMSIIMATLLTRTRLRLVAGADRSPRYGGVTIGPADGLRVVVDEVRPRAVPAAA
jgi:cytochrome P450